MKKSFGKLIFKPAAGFDASIVWVLAVLHLGDQIRHVYKFLRRIAAGQNKVLYLVCGFMDKCKHFFLRDQF